VLDFAPLQLNQNAGQSAAGSAGAAANAYKNAAGAGNVAAEFRARLPRWGFPSDISVVGGGGQQAADYGIGVGIQFGYGIVLAILTVLVGCCFCICRCCCNWCGGREPEEFGYTKCQRWGTLTVMTVFALAVTGFAAEGWYSNQLMTEVIVGKTGVMQAGIDLMGNTIFLMSAQTSVAGIQPSVPITSIYTLFKDIQGSVNSIVPAINDTINTIGTGVFVRIHIMPHLSRFCFKSCYFWPFLGSFHFSLCFVRALSAVFLAKLCLAPLFYIYHLLLRITTFVCFV
jgi:hypothetical protein